MRRIIRFWLSAFALIAACALTFWNCNLDDSKGTTTLNLKVPDSLNVANGYDSVVVDIYNGQGTLVYPRIFHGKYNSLNDSATLANIQLANPIPDPMMVKVNAYKGKTKTWEVDITISNGKATRHDTISVDPGNPANGVPTSILITNPTPLVLHVGATPSSLSTTVQPPEAAQTVTWSLEAAGVAEIVNGNQIRGLKAGTAKAIATSTAKTSITASLDIVVDSVSLKPQGITLLMPVPLTLAVGGIDADLSGQVTPNGAAQDILWSSADPDIVQITSDNKAKAIKVGKATLTAKAKADSSVSVSFDANVIVPVKVDGITISPKTLSLFTGGEDGKVTPTMATSDTAARYTLTSSAPSIASVNADGTVKAWKPGLALITASVVGYPAIASVCSVTVATDPPVPAITPDQTLTAGAEATFDVSVTQAYGTVALIKADMDGDGVYEQSVSGKSTAQFKAKYTEVKTYSLSFVILDSEGNSVEVKRTVKVNPPAAPAVDIFDPASDITINQLTYKIRFTLKDPSRGIDTTLDSTVTLTDGANTVSASRTNAGGTGKDQVTITVNRNAPGLPVFAAQSQFTNDNTPTWSWSAVPGAAKYQYRMGDGDFTKAAGNTETTALSYTLATSPDGDYSLFLRSVDALGNASSAVSQLVTIDTKAPDAVTFVGTDNGYTDFDTPTWRWSPSKTNGGINAYEITLDNTPTPVIVNDTSYTPASPLSDNQTHTLSVRQKDRVSGVFGAAKAFRYQIAIYAPAAPVVSGPSGVVNNGKTNKLDFTWTSGARGIDTYRIKVNTESSYRDSTNTTRKFSLSSNTPDGTYTIHVQELDGLGRWGSEGSFTVQLDRTGPSVTVTTRDNFITNTSPAKIDYKVDGVATSANCVLSKSNQANTCTVIGTDDLGNATQATTTVYYRPNTYFINANNAIDGDGSSWEQAKKDPSSLMSDTKNASKNEYWIAGGTYGGMEATYSLSIFGGFNATKFPVDTIGRDPTATIADQAFFHSNEYPETKIVIDKLVMVNGITSSNIDMILNDFQIKKDTPGAGSGIYVMGKGTFIANNVMLSYGTFLYTIVTIQDEAEAVFTNTYIYGNTIIDSPTPVEISGNAKFSMKGPSSTIASNTPTNGSQVALYGNVTFVMGSDASFDCSLINLTNFTGSGTCKGVPLAKP